MNLLLREKMTTLTTTWTMDQDDVNALVTAQEWNSWILQVGGTANHVTWFDHNPFQEINDEVVYDQSLYAIPATDLTDGAVLNLDGIVHYPVNEGCCYTWDGTGFVKEKTKCALSSIKVTNMATAPWVVGLTQVDMPICADILPAPVIPPATPSAAPAGGGGANPAPTKPAVDGPNVIVYTPTKTIYVTVGKTYKAASVVKDPLTAWTGPFVITTPKSSFEFDNVTQKWAVPTSK